MAKAAARNLGAGALAIENQQLRQALAKIEDTLTDYLIANTDVDRGFEAIPEVDEARTVAQEALEAAA